MNKILKLMILFPFFCHASPGFFVENQTDLAFTSLIGNQTGLPLPPGQKINVPFGPMQAKCRAARQMETCLLNIFNGSNSDLVAIIPFNPIDMFVVSKPEIQVGYQDIVIEGWDTSDRIENIVVYRS